MPWVDPTRPVKDEGPQDIDAPTVDLADKDGVRHITLIRCETSPGDDMWHIKFVHGLSRAGTPVRVNMPVWDLPRQGFTYALIQLFTDNKRWAKAMKVFDEGVLSKEW